MTALAPGMTNKGESMNEVLVQEPAQVVPAPLSPMSMIQLAVSRGAGIDELTKLMDLQERVEKNDARKAFVQALNEFKANPPEILKNKAVAFGGAGKTAYKHATLDNVSGIIGAALAKVGISHRWDTEQLEGGLIRVTCVLTHSLGHSERVPLQASPDSSGSKNAIQAVGSTVTYLQRYTLLAATGMAVHDQDDDGKLGKGNALSDKELADWEAAVGECADTEAWEKLWTRITAATTKAGDVQAHEKLRALMAAKFKSIKGAK